MDSMLERYWKENKWFEKDKGNLNLSFKNNDMFELDITYFKQNAVETEAEL